MVFTHREQWYSPTATAEREDEVRGSMQCQEIASTRRIRYGVDGGQRVTHGMRSMVAYVSQGYGVDSDQRIAQDIVSMVANASQGGMGSTVVNRVAQGLVWRSTSRSRYGVINASKRYGADGGQRVAQGMAPMVVNASLMVWYRW